MSRARSDQGKSHTDALFQMCGFRGRQGQAQSRQSCWRPTPLRPHTTHPGSELTSPRAPTVLLGRGQGRRRPFGSEARVAHPAQRPGCSLQPQPHCVACACWYHVCLLVPRVLGRCAALILLEVSPSSQWLVFFTSVARPSLWPRSFDGSRLFADERPLNAL